MTVSFEYSALLVWPDGTVEHDARAFTSPDEVAEHWWAGCYNPNVIITIIERTIVYSDWKPLGGH